MSSESDVRTQITARRAVFNVFALSGTFFALLTSGMYFVKGGSLPSAIALGYVLGAVMALFYYVRHRNQLHQSGVLYEQ